MRAIVDRDSALDRIRRASAQILESPRFVSAVFVALVLWEVAVLSLRASRRQFWYDELITFYLSGLQSFSLLWKALEAAIDGMPPNYYVIVRLARMIPGDPHLILRLPSLAGYVLALVGVYLFARRRMSAVAGLTAAILIALSPLRQFAFEARSYALMVGFVAMAAVTWQRIGEKRFMTPLFGLFLALAVSCHHLAILLIPCFAIAELTSIVVSRRIRWAVWIAWFSAAVPFFVALPLLQRYRGAYALHFFSRPGWMDIINTYQFYLAADYRLALPFLILFILAASESVSPLWGRLHEGRIYRDLPAHEVMLVGGLFAYAGVLVAIAIFFDAGYTPRYGWPAIVGLTLGWFSCFLPSRFLSRSLRSRYW